jgi:cytochrome c-type biogenesis protein CcmF
MQSVQYIGEQLLPGRIGHFAIILGFVAALLSAGAYFMAVQRRSLPEAAGWLKIGRGAFTVHGLGILSTIGIIFYLMVQQRYEYQYVWAHVSEELPFKYIFSAFWEGQEGSFLLWMFWHIVLGMVLMFRGREWEASTLAVVSAVQAVLASMILGIHLGWGDQAPKLGSNPLLLLRETMDAPIFNNADYLKLIKGNGLNPLLQNYWMTIHPPTLFLGFASVTIPFAYAMAGLWERKHREWLAPALPWALFSGAILGTGILMGGAWAYEALSFGGYWAWDPVENMSLVPWLILIGGIHTNLIAKSTGQSIKSTYIFYLLAFVMIVYSTFLTRSGVLGDTSVHAFTEMGLEAQLIGFLLLAGIGGGGLYLLRQKGIPVPEKEEPLPSKEFWMFIGTLVLLFSAAMITVSTSLPVFNKIMQVFNPVYQGRVITDPVAHYNKNQLYLAIFIGLLSGVAQFLRFREPNWKNHLKQFALHSSVAIALAFVLSFLVTQWIEINAWQYWLLLFSAVFTVVSNLDYLLAFLRSNLKAGGSAFSHIGFGIMIVGVLASGLNKQIISNNPFVMDGLIEGADEEALRKNILLFKNSPTLMAGYEVTYTKDTLETYTRTFTVNFKRKGSDGKVLEEFELYPNVLYEKTFEKIAASNPSTRRYFNKDIFTHIASLPTVEIDLTQRQAKEDSLNYRQVPLLKGQQVTFLDTVRLDSPDTSLVRQYTLKLEAITWSPKNADYLPEPGDYALGARIVVERDDQEERFVAEPVLVLRSGLLLSYPAQINGLSARIRLNDAFLQQVMEEEERMAYEKFEIGVGESIRFKNFEVYLEAFEKSPSTEKYRKKEGDLAVGAQLRIKNPEGKTSQAQPVFLIRDNEAYDYKDISEDFGLHFRFPRLDPKSGKITLLVASPVQSKLPIPVELATDALRSDYIVLEAIEFPGINLFWLGTSMMMVGLALSMGYRITKK